MNAIVFRDVREVRCEEIEKVYHSYDLVSVYPLGNSPRGVHVYILFCNRLHLYMYMKDVYKYKKVYVYV